MKFWHLVLVFGLIVSMGCEDDGPALDDQVRNEIFKVLQSGAEHPTDPYVRAETMRVLEFLKDPAFNNFAEGRLKDSSAMVRVAALRVLLANNHAEARSLALQMFNETSGPERLAVLSATLEHAPEPVQRELIGRAIRSPDEDVRQIAFEQGYINRIDSAIAESKTQYLERSLYPELARFMNLDDPILAARALEKFLEVGQADRAETFVKIFSRGDVSLEERTQACYVLVGAGAQAAKEHFTSLLERNAEILNDTSLGVPVERVEPELVKCATLGLTALGEESTIADSQKYLKGATIQETVRILNALAKSPSEESEISLRVAMQDSRNDVRNRAIELYAQRADASPEALIRAMSGAPFATQKRISEILRTKFKDAWTKELSSALQRTSEVDRTLMILRDVIVTQQEANDIIIPIKPELQKIADEGHEERAPLAAYLLALTVEPLDDKAIAELDRKFDDPTRYAFIEFQVRENHMDYQRLFRVYFNADLYVIRLMSAAGMWRAAQSGAAPVASPSNSTNGPVDE